METESRNIIQSCYVNGKTCRNGKRDDFNIDSNTGEKFYCNKWVKLLGQDPQTGKDIETWCCAEFAKIKLMLENSFRTRQVTSALDRNNNTFFSALPENIQRRIVEKLPIKDAHVDTGTESKV